MTKAWLALASTVLALSSLGSLAACGPSNDKPTTPAAEPSMDDALALLPGNAIAVGTVDARAFYGSQTFGADIAKLTEKYIPIGQEAGFSASRDVDRITWASYSFQGIDVAAVVIGKFDEAKIKAAAAAHTPLKGGSATIVASQYAGRDLYTVSNVGFTLLSSERAIAGTESGIRRVLERIKDKRVKRDIASWMITTVETSGAAATAAVDLATTPLPPEVARQIPLPFMTGLKAVRAVATFDNGVQVAGSMTYTDENAAQTGSQGVKQAQTFSKVLGLLGVNIKKFDVTVDKADVQVKIAIDDSSLHTIATSLPQWLGQPQ